MPPSGRPWREAAVHLSRPAPSAADSLSAADYRAILGFLETQAGICLGEGKEYLVLSRLRRLLPAFELAGYGELAARLSDCRSARLQTAVVDAMTTNETFWFRDAAHFQVLTDSLLAEAAPRRLRVWSAAASTGQEAYTAAICLQDAMRAGRVDSRLSYEILGTDVSSTAVAQAQRASYCGPGAARGLSEELRGRCFRERDGCLELLPAYRQGTAFRSFNLLQPFDALGRFDVVFCRNVLIYFSQARKRDILARLARVLNPGGHLFIGSTESMSGHEDLFQMRSLHGTLVYRLR
jgi:chemotaxis protein methyltransferase CheR